MTFGLSSVLIIGVWQDFRPVEVPHVGIVPRRCGVVGGRPVRERAADEGLLELQQVGRVARLALEVRGDEHVKLGELVLAPAHELGICDVVVPLGKLLLELLGRSLQVELEVVVDRMSVGSVADVEHKRGVHLEFVLYRRSRVVELVA